MMSQETDFFGVPQEMDPFWRTPKDGLFLGCPTRWTLLMIPKEMDLFGGSPKDGPILRWPKRWTLLMIPQKMDLFLSSPKDGPIWGLPKAIIPFQNRPGSCWAALTSLGGLVKPCPGHHPMVGHQGGDAAARDTPAEGQALPSWELLAILLLRNAPSLPQDLTGDLMGHKKVELLYGWAGIDPSHELFTLLTHPVRIPNPPPESLSTEIHTEVCWSPNFSSKSVRLHRPNCHVWLWVGLATAFVLLH